MQTWMNDKCDRSKWPAGPWDGEPDKVQWKDAKTGLDCLANRATHSGHWCGYVGVPPGHPLHGRDYEAPNVSVHGGLTFASECSKADEPCRGICHIAAEGEPEHLWWFGFDCAHCDDASPYDYQREPEGYPWSPVHGVYRDLGYIKAECASLAAQLVQQPINEVR